MQTEQLEVRRVRMLNSRDTDLVVRDYAGVEHVLFPKREKEIDILVPRERKRGSKLFIHGS
jgi:hypothetical protein